MDLKFPHHENEEAQAYAYCGHSLANIWMHNGMLNINNEKMSKSAGNFFTVRDISKKYDLQVIRFFMLEAHYRSPLNFSDQLVESAKSALERILNCVDMLRDQAQADENTRLTDADKANVEKINGFVKNFENSMEDDFNTADAIAAIFDMVKLANITAKDGSREYAQYVLDKLTTLLGVLGIETEKKEELLDSDIEALIEERQQARKAKNFKRADEIRDELAAKGIILEDTRAGVKWKRA